MTRKPIAAMMTPEYQNSEGDQFGGSLVVICDDGAAFSFSWSEGAWLEMAPIPGTAAANPKKPLAVAGVSGGTRPPADI